jgi:hypothetical protein
VSEQNTRTKDAVPAPGAARPPGCAVAAFELIPGHPATGAEVLLWCGAVPGVSEDRGPWVVLRGDDWPMSADVARRLAAALVEAADRVDAAGGEKSGR